MALVRAFQVPAARRGGKVFACDITNLAPAMHAADGAFLVPKSTDDDFIPEIIRLCREHEVGCIVPTIDTELPALSAAREQMKSDGIHVMISSPRCIEIGLDKVETNRWLLSEGFPTVRQWSLPDAQAHCHQFPLIVKPRRGSASIGVRRLTSASALSELDDVDLVVQEVASGSEYTVDVLVNRAGKCVAAVPRQRLEVRAGEVSKGVTRRAPELEKLARDLAERLPGAYGALNIQMFQDGASGDVRIIEINPRFGGGYPLTHEAGADFASWMVSELAGCEPVSLDWHANLTMLRFDDAVFIRETKGV